MKILYAIQGTGNGHVSRARDIIPALAKHGTVHTLISGTQADVNPGFEVNHRYKGLGFIFGKKGGVDLFKTFMKAKSRRFYREIKQVPVSKYDLIISDFEPVSAWACYAAGIPCVQLSHQAAVINPASPKPASIDYFGQLVLKYYAPQTEAIGFHFQEYAPNIHTPVIRSQIRDLEPEIRDHYTVYLPAYDDERIFEVLSKISEVKWQVFSKHNREAFKRLNVSFQPVQNESFVHSLATSAGLLCGAGFETPAEALFMKKKVMVIPMKNQFEQHCNAAALAKMGVPVLKSLKKKHAETIAAFIKSDKVIEVNYPDQTQAIIDGLVHKYAR